MSEQTIDWEKSDKFEEIWKNFFEFITREDILEEEFREIRILFGANEVRELVEFIWENIEYASNMMERIKEFNKMNLYLGCFVGYLIGYFGENEVVSEECDFALVKFYTEKVLKNCSIYLDTIMEQLGTTTAKVIQQNKLREMEQMIEEIDPLEIYKEHREIAKAWQGVSLCSLGVMSRITRNRKLRDYLRNIDEILLTCNVLSHFRENIGYIPWVLNMAEEETIILIVPEKKRGIEVKIEQIDSEDVFFTLLQFELYHKNMLEPLGAMEFTYNEAIEKIAKHEWDKEELPDPLTDYACFDYYSYSALRADGSYEKAKAISGTETILRNPRLDGKIVILLASLTVRKSWSNAYVCGTHPGLQPKVEFLRELPKAEVEQWTKKIYETNIGKVCK